MSRKKPMPGASRVVRYYRTPYERAMEQVERERDHMFEAVRRVWGCAPEQCAQVIGSASGRSLMTFDEILFWLYEQLLDHGSGAIARWASDELTLACE